MVLYFIFQLVQVSSGGEPCTLYSIDTFVPLVYLKVTFKRVS